MEEIDSLFVKIRDTKYLHCIDEGCFILVYSTKNSREESYKHLAGATAYGRTDARECGDRAGCVTIHPFAGAVTASHVLQRWRSHWGNITSNAGDTICAP